MPTIESQKKPNKKENIMNHIRHYSSIVLISLGFNFQGLAAENVAAERVAEDNPIPARLITSYEALQAPDKLEVIKLYNNKNPNCINIPGRSSGINIKYNESLLKCLDIQNNCVGYFTLSHILGDLTFTGFLPLLPKYQALQTLDISGNNISDKMLKKHIATFVNLVNLKDLSLASNKIKDAGFILVFSAFNIPNCPLKTLRLEKNEINQKSVVDHFKRLFEENKSIYLTQLDLYAQDHKVGNEAVEAEYEVIVSTLQTQFPAFSCILQKKDAHLLSSKSILPLQLLKIASLKDPIEFELLTTPTLGDAIPLSNSPQKLAVSKNMWSGNMTKCIMAIDPSGSGSDATGYAVIKVNANLDYLVNTAGGIKGDGLKKETFLQLIKIAVDEKVDHIVIESNFHNGAYLELFNTHYIALARETYWKKGLNPDNYLDDIQPKFDLHNFKTTDKDKGTRIIKTLSDLLNVGGLYIEEEFFKDDYANRNNKPSLFLEMSWMKPNFQSQGTKDGQHDDVVDALEMGIRFYQTKILKPTLQ